MYAVIELDNNQYVVKKNEEIIIDKFYTEPEKKETARQIKLIMEQWAVTNSSQEETAKSKD